MAYINIAFDFFFVSTQDSFSNAFFLIASIMPIVVKIPPFSTYNKKVFEEMEVAMGKTRVIFLLTVFVGFYRFLREKQ